jgi:hypothetical protein
MPTPLRIHHLRAPAGEAVLPVPQIGRVRCGDPTGSHQQPSAGRTGRTLGRSRAPAPGRAGTAPGGPLMRRNWPWAASIPVAAYHRMLLGTTEANRFPREASPPCSRSTAGAVVAVALGIHAYVAGTVKSAEEAELQDERAPRHGRAPGVGRGGQLRGFDRGRLRPGGRPFERLDARRRRDRPGRTGARRDRPRHARRGRLTLAWSEGGLELHRPQGGEQQQQVDRVQDGRPS